MGEDCGRDVVDRSDTRAGMVRMADRMNDDDVVDGFYRTPGLGGEKGEGDVDCENVEWTKIVKGKGWLFTAAMRQRHVQKKAGRTYKSWMSIGYKYNLRGRWGILSNI
jgi:hypothetical protein